MSTTTRPARAQANVEDFDRRPAAEAAIALRRAGLRPALERTFHWGEDTHGLVVAQEPPAGREVPLDSTVLLFISAPGERGDRDANEDTPEVRTPAQPDDQPVAQHPAELAGAYSDDPCRRRGPGLADTGPDMAVDSATEMQAGPGLEDQNHGEESAIPCGFETDSVRREAETWAPGDENPLLELAQAQLAAGAFAGSGRMRKLECDVLRERVSSATVAAVVVAFLVTLGVVLLAGHAHALQAAGAFNGTPISGVQTFVDKLRGNLVWLGGTAMGLVIAVVGIMFMAGHSRAHDLAIRTIAGLAILASVSGIVA
jgi:hypothetical protein